MLKDKTAFYPSPLNGEAIGEIVSPIYGTLNPQGEKLSRSVLSMLALC